MLRKSFWMLKGKPVQSVLHMLLMVLIGFALFIGIIFQQVGQFIKSGGTFYYTIKVEPKDVESIISRETINQLSKIQNIKGYNYSYIKEIQPENFKNWVQYYDKNDPELDLAELSINLDVEFSDIFVNNSAALVEGSLPTESKHGVIVEQVMAEHNNIQIGDIVAFKTTEDGNTLCLQVIGIYRLRLPIKVEDAAGGDISYVVSPYSRLYTNFDSIAADADIAIPYVDLYISEDNYILTLNDFNGTLDASLKASDSTDSMFVVLNQAVNKMIRYYNWIIYMLALTTLVIFTLFSFIAQHKSLYDTSVLSVLGKSKREILMQSLLNTSILSGVSAVIFAILALILARPVGLFWISAATKDYSIEVSNFSFQGEKEALISNYASNRSVALILIIVFFLFFISLLVTLLYSLSVLKLTPLKRLNRAC